MYVYIHIHYDVSLTDNLPNCQNILWRGLEFYKNSPVKHLFKAVNILLHTIFGSRSYQWSSLPLSQYTQPQCLYLRIGIGMIIILNSWKGEQSLILQSFMVLILKSRNLHLKALFLELYNYLHVKGGRVVWHLVVKPVQLNLLSTQWVHARTSQQLSRLTRHAPTCALRPL